MDRGKCVSRTKQTNMSMKGKNGIQLLKRDESAAAHSALQENEALGYGLASGTLWVGKLAWLKKRRVLEQLVCALYRGDQMRILTV